MGILTSIQSRSPTTRAFSRSTSLMARRNSKAAVERRPRLKVFRLPSGASAERPPCIRHRPFSIAGPQHGRPVGLPSLGGPFQIWGDAGAVGLVEERAAELTRDAGAIEEESG